MGKVIVSNRAETRASVVSVLTRRDLASLGSPRTIKELWANLNAAHTCIHICSNRRQVQGFASDRARLRTHEWVSIRQGEHGASFQSPLQVLWSHRRLCTSATCMFVSE